MITNFTQIHYKIFTKQIMALSRTAYPLLCYQWIFNN